MIRTRFAPSPTGFLHIGGARTALYSWLHARQHGGRFILRIEDTDRERSTEESVNAILEGMAWLGLDYDEGPFFQTHRFDRYGEVLQQLLNEGKAYRCYCTKEELDTMRTEQLARKEKPRYDGRCRYRTEPRTGVEPVIRFKNPLDGDVVVDDQIKGRVVFANQELDDLIIARSDGTPTYNFTVVVDDADMGITHVIRGDDHLNNTPRQINLLRAMDVAPPAYAHVPMILGADGQRLSKRHGAVSVLQYRDEGYLPEALLNYLVRLGWSHGDQEIFTREDLMSHFAVSNVNKAASSINPDKLLWLNQHYLKTMDPVYVAEHLSFHLGTLGIDPAGGPALADVVIAQRERAKTLVEMAQNSVYFYRDIGAYEDKAAKHLSAETAPLLLALHEGFSILADWQAAAIHQVVIDTSERMGQKLGKVAQPLRVALTGGTVSPPIDITAQLIGREKTLARIAQALKHIGDNPGP